MVSKKKLTYITIAVFFFLSGVEYAVILPTMWLYISERYHAQEYFLGVMLSAFSAADLVCSPIYGKISDKTRQIKALIFVSTLFEIVGSLMYTMGISLGFLVGSRLIAGIGSGSGAAVVAEITRTTSVTERTGILSLIMACRQLGLVVGPAFNLFLSQLDFKISIFVIDKYTSPGVFMACLWVLHQIMLIFCYTDFIHFTQNESIPEAEAILPHEDENYAPINAGAEISTKSTLEKYMDEFLRDEIVAILAVIFGALFNQTALEAMVTPLTQKYMNWGELENSLMYAGCGVEIIFVFFVVRWASKRCSDRSLIVFGSIMSVIGLIFFIAVFPRAKPNAPSNLPFFIIGVAIDVLSLPFLVTCAISLYSKVVSSENQGLAQGIRRSVIGAATIMGPLWAGSLINHLYIMVGVLISLVLFVMILLLLSFKRLNPLEDEAPSSEAQVAEASNESSERRGLLADEGAGTPNRNYETTREHTTVKC